MKTDAASGKKLEVLMTCHNRREKTLRSLAALFSALPEAELDVSVHLVDDGSSDGTGDAVRQAYPSVSVITGDGTLFWNRVMRTAWEDALQKDADCYLWLNDASML
ncbi:glycosyltransferase, partial [Akkermansia sp.]|uniref:glycosyltransferase family 2 protein n=1 Tax=Akkermansia sp. TaxID=1872421 RepID=UPI0025BE10C2